MILDEQGKPRYYGAYRGVVYSNQDPLSRGRLRIKVPQVLADEPTQWAWPVDDSVLRQSPPLVGQGVWVSFEGGDPSYPIWQGIFGNKVTSEMELYVRPFTAAETSFNAAKILETKTLGNGEQVVDLTATLSKVASTLGSSAGGVASVQAEVDALELVVSNLATTAFTSTSTFLGTVQNVTEKVYIDSTTTLNGSNAIVAAPATKGNAVYYTVNAGANFAVQLTTTDTGVEIGESFMYAFMVTNGTTGYVPSGYTLNGSAVTPKWQGGTAPTTANASCVDAYTFTIMRTATSSYTVFASRTKFA